MPPRQARKPALLGGGFVGLEVLEERGVLREIRLHLADAGARPVLKPGLAQIVLDVVEAALAHRATMIGAEDRNRHGPIGSTFGLGSPTEARQDASVDVEGQRALVFVRDLFSVVMMLSVYTGLLATTFAVLIRSRIFELSAIGCALNARSASGDSPGKA